MITSNDTKVTCVVKNQLKVLALVSKMNFPRNDCCLAPTCIIYSLESYIEGWMDAITTKVHRFFMTWL